MHRSLPAGIRGWITRTAWTELIAAAPQFEIGQAWMRLAWSTFFLLGMTWKLLGIDRPPIELSCLLWFLVGFAIFAVAIILWTLAVPRDSPLRRILGLAADNIAITYLMLVLGEVGAVIFGMYLFTAFGNGFRYGRVYLYLSRGMALVGFGLVLSVSDVWPKHPWVGMGLLVMLIVLPFYVGVLAHQMRARHLKTGQALEECLEGEQRKT